MSTVYQSDDLLKVGDTVLVDKPHGGTTPAVVIHVDAGGVMVGFDPPVMTWVVDRRQVTRTRKES